MQGVNIEVDASVLLFHNPQIKKTSPLKQQHKYLNEI